MTIRQIKRARKSEFGLGSMETELRHCSWIQGTLFMLKRLIYNCYQQCIHLKAYTWLWSRSGLQRSSWTLRQ